MAPPFFAALIVLAGCASGTTRTLSSPSVTITQTSVVEPIDAAASTPVPVEFRLDVTNPFDHPVTLTAVEIETVGLAGGYSMRRVRHAFARVIPARSSDAIDLRAWVRPLQTSDRGDIVASVILRGVARFDANGRVMKTAFAGRAAQRPSY